MTEDPSKNTDRDDKGRFLTGNNGGGRPRGARSKLGDEFLQALAEDFYENGENAIKQVRMRDPTAYLKIVKDILPREVVTTAFGLNVNVEGEFPDNTTIEGILQAVAREAGVEEAKLLAKAFDIEWAGPVIEAKAEAQPVDLETAKGYATRQRQR